MKFTTNATTVEYDYDTQFIDFNEATKTITGKVVGETSIIIRASSPNGRPVEEDVTVTIMALSDIPKDIDVINDALIVASESDAATEVTISRGLNLTTSLNPDLGKIKVEDITPPDPVPDPDTENKDEETEMLTSKYKVTYTAPLTTTDRNITLTLNTDYRGQAVGTKDITITVNKKTLPTGMTTSVDNIELEALDTATFTVNIPDNTDLTLDLSPNTGTITKTEK